VGKAIVLRFFIFITADFFWFSQKTTELLVLELRLINLVFSRFYMTQVLVNGLMLGSTYMLMALGITLIFAIMNVMNFAHGQMYVFGGFVTYYVFGQWHLPFVVALLASALVVAVIGFLFERFLFRPVMRRSNREETTMLLAVGTALLLDSVALVLFGEKQRGVPDVIAGVWQVAGAFIPYRRLLVFGVSIALAVGFLAFVQFTRPGRALRAIAQDRETAAAHGVDVALYSAFGFALGAMLAGLAGGLLVSTEAVNAGAGGFTSIKAFTMIMIGGAGVVSGAIAGAFMLAFAEAIGYYFLPGSMPYLIILVGLIVFLVFRPQGIMGKRWG
jgi:branched-chain amino acid transport system permease protein